MMEVLLYVYDLSHGLARQMSMQYLGIQIDAVYHTSVVLNNIEYYYGAGIQMGMPGMTHHGRPMQVVNLGKTSLPLDLIESYLESIRDMYRPESYDLFTHNCNNFTDDFAQFLTGNSIPSHITNLPRQVLDTPLGMMLRPSLDASLRTVTQAGVPAQTISHGSDVHGTHLTPATQTKTPRDESLPDQKARMAGNCASAQTKIHPHENLSLVHIFMPSPNSSIFEDTSNLDEPSLHLSDHDVPLIPDAIEFIKKREQNRLGNASSPNLPMLRAYFRRALTELPPDTLSARLELLSLLLLDEITKCFFAKEEVNDSTILLLLDRIKSFKGQQLGLQVAAVRVAVNFLSSPVGCRTIRNKPEYANKFVELLASTMLGPQKSEFYTLASALALNLCTAHLDGALEAMSVVSASRLQEPTQVEIAAALLEALSSDNESMASRTRVLALGRLLYLAPEHGELIETCNALEAQTILKDTERIVSEDDKPLISEVVSLLGLEKND